MTEDGAREQTTVLSMSYRGCKTNKLSDQNPELSKFRLLSLEEVRIVLESLHASPTNRSSAFLLSSTIVVHSTSLCHNPLNA